MAEQPQDDPAPGPVPESSGPAAPKPEGSKAEASKPEPTVPGPMAPDTTEPAIPEPLADVGPLPDAPEHRWFRYLTHFFRRAVGPARGLTDPQLFHKISLAAFMAWVGLGADGLSSSAYGPEVAFLALEGNYFLAIPLAILTAVTVGVIAASYMRIIERFPAGGGGYVVATKLLG